MYAVNREEYEARMKWYQEARFGMFIHWGLYSIPARGEWVRSTEEIPEEEYLPFMKEFDARDYNPKQWAKEAKEAGVKLAVGGKGMLLWQGAESYKLYTGLEMPTDEYQKFQAENEGK